MNLKGAMEMKKVIAITLVLVCLLAAPLCAAQAEGLGALGDLLGSLGDLFEDEPAEEADESAAAPETFDGPLVEVVVDEESGETIEVHEDFKEYMDAYEDFFDEYADVMSEDNPDTLALLDVTARYFEMLDAMKALEDAELSDGDAAYYLLVSGRISAKLALVE